MPAKLYILPVRHPDPYIDERREAARRWDHLEASAIESGQCRKRLFRDASDDAVAKAKHARAGFETARRMVDDLPPSAA